MTNIILTEYCLNELHVFSDIFGLTSDRGSNPRSATPKASTLTITPPMQLYVHNYYIWFKSV